MRLVIACSSVELGGAEQSTANLLATLSPSITVTVLGVDGAICTWLAGHRPGTEVVLVPPIESKRDFAAMRAHRRAVASLQPHVYQATLTSVFSGEYALLGAMLVPGVATIAVEQLPMFTMATWARRKLKRFVARRLTAHVAVSDAAARVLEEELELEPRSIRTIHNGVPDIELPSVPRRDAAPVIGTFARLVPSKGIDVLCRALVRVPGVRAVVVGAGPEEAALRALADDLGVGDRVELVGWHAHPRTLLPEFDVFVLPSRVEGLPLSIAEAMLARLPVVATDVGGVSEIVADQATGIVVPPDDPDALAAAVTALLDDPRRREQMGTAGRARALEQFSVDTMTSAYERLYAEIVTARADAGPR